MLQVLPRGWRDSARAELGDLADRFPADTWHDDPAALRGEGDFLADLAARLSTVDHVVSAADLTAVVPHSVTTIPEVLALVPRLRAAGYGVHLGSNQERNRAAYMADVLGYGELFDVSCYSCDLGAAKPAAEFFLPAAERIGTDPGTVLFVDDLAANVEGARAAGLVAERWRVDLGAPDRGVPGLLDLLALHGVVPAPG